MPGSLLEIADIFRAVTPKACVPHDGAVWRKENAGHISFDQFKVMNAIERCPSAALGGHVARCADCAYEHIAYNSCRNYYPVGDLV